MGPDLQDTVSWAPMPPAPPWKSECYPGLARSSQPALSCSALPLVGGSRGVCVQRSSGGSRLGTMNKAWDSLLSTGSSTAIQGDSENQVLVLVERRR